MRISGLVAPLSKVSLSGLLRKSPAAIVASALILSACVETTSNGSATQNAPALAQPEIITDATIYAARSDGQFSIPALPVEQIPESHRRQLVAYESDQAPGTIIIDPRTKLLYFVLGDGKAIRYGISVGAEGFQWSGESIVANKRTWPTWTPPKEMIARKPSLEKWANGQPGGPTNPLGSRAIYLTSGGRDYGYRIHGTPEWRSIGRNASSGCFRMINQDVMDLYERVQPGAKVIVLTASGEMPKGLNIPKPIVPKKADPKPETEAKPVVAPPMIGPAMPGAPAATSPAADSPAVTTPAVTTPAVVAPAGDAVAPAVVVPAVPAAPAAGTAPAAASPAAPAVTPAPAATPAATPAEPAAAPATPACTGPDCPAN